MFAQTKATTVATTSKTPPADSVFEKTTSRSSDEPNGWINGGHSDSSMEISCRPDFPAHLANSMAGRRERHERTAGGEGFADGSATRRGLAHPGLSREAEAASRLRLD